ncbi:MAG TPA: DUF6794 domain-containing protein [Ktedonobacterales bacterium]|nr:DUF6794 domain-containing protein [Ktedonobacterales bacterium]
MNEGAVKVSLGDTSNNGRNGAQSDTGDIGAKAKGGNWPQSVDEAVDRLLAGISDEDKGTVRSTPKDELYTFHFGWGMGIRNAFGFWQGNAALLKSCAEAQYGPDATFIHPDSASGVIIEAVWQRLCDE